MKLSAEEILQQLIAIPSVSSVTPSLDMSSSPLMDRLADWFDGLGWKVELLPVPNTHAKINLLATLGDGKGGLVLAGHGDTVPYDEGGWDSDPFALTEIDGRLHGLGTADMKGFIALAVELASTLKTRELKRPIHIVVTPDEESRMAGARLLVERGCPEAEYCIIGEPTDLTPVYMHKGVMMEAVRVLGATGHSSDPDRSPNALEGMTQVLNALLTWRDELRQHTNQAFSVPYPTLNLGRLQGGDNPNRICGEAELHLDLRPLPGMTLRELREELRRRVETVLAGTRFRYEIFSLFDGIEPFGGQIDGPLVSMTSEASGKRAQAVSFGTEAGFFSAMGMETVVIGPGRIEQAHRPNEYLEKSALAAGRRFLRSIVARSVLSDG